MTRIRTFLILLLTVTVLAACESREERAERYYQSALTLLEEGDVDRALIELRNVFDNDGFHREARRLYADLLLEEGQAQEAYGQYLRLIEQYPDTMDVRRKLAEFSIDNGNWEEARRHGEAAIELDPDLPEHRALETILAYHVARVARDDVAAGEAVERAQALLEENPDLDTALRVLVDWYVSGPDPEQALPYLERLTEMHPDSLSLRMTRVRVLDQMGRRDEIGPVLRDMFERFPEDEEVASMLIRWYLSRQEFDEAETFLREQAGADDAEPEGHFAVVQFLLQLRGPEEALAELERLASANDGTDLGRRYALEASKLRFDAGATDEAMQTASNIAEAAGDTALVNDARITLSRMRSASGDVEGARTLVSEVLESDPSNVDGLLMQAAWRIRGDEMGAAVTDLRLALDQDPRNIRALLLLAEAQQKLGNIELAEQRLAQAVEISGSAAEESLIYARFQISRGLFGQAEQVLTESLRATGNLEVAQMLGRVLLQQGDVEGARDVLAQFANSDNPNAAPMARSLQAAIMFSQNQIDESLELLRETADSGEGEADMGAEMQMLRIQMMSGRFDEAERLLEELRAEDPENVALRLLEANLSAVRGNREEAIRVLREVVEDAPEQIIAIQRLYTLLNETGQGEEATQVLSEALERQPDEPQLLVLRALELERAAEPEEAIAIYERLYEQNPDDIIAANNLASMLATARDDAESIDRAYRIAQRLRGMTQPALLDTLGWVQLRKGEVDRAILNLQAAARGLPDNPSVAFNLGLAYAEAGRTSEALAELERGFELAGDDTSVAQYQRAKERMAELDG